MGGRGGFGRRRGNAVYQNQDPRRAGFHHGDAHRAPRRQLRVHATARAALLLCSDDAAAALLLLLLLSWCVMQPLLAGDWMTPLLAAVLRCCCVEAGRARDSSVPLLGPDWARCSSLSRQFRRD